MSNYNRRKITDQQEHSSTVCNVRLSSTITCVKNVIPVMHNVMANCILLVRPRQIPFVDQIKFCIQFTFYTTANHVKPCN